MNAAFARAQAAYASDGLATTPSTKLLVLLLQRAMRDLDDARRALAGSNIEAAHTALMHAQDIIHELHLALDPDGFDGGRSLADLYGYLTERLIAANSTKRTEIVDECEQLLAPIAEAFTEAAQLGRDITGVGAAV